MTRFKTITKTHAIEFFSEFLQFFENLARIMGKKQKGSNVEAKVAKSDPLKAKNESNKKNFKKDKKKKQPKNVNGEKDFPIKSPKDSPKTENESKKKKFKKDKKNKQPKNVNGEKDFKIKSPKDSPTTENNSKKKKFKRDKKNQQQENVNEEKDLQIKKNIQANPQLLKQELEVLVKNLNKEAKLQDYFVKKDEDVSGNFFLKYFSI